MGPFQSPVLIITAKVYWALTIRQTWFYFTCFINSFSPSNPSKEAGTIVIPHFMKNRGPEQLSNLHKVTRRVEGGAGVGKRWNPNSSQSLAIWAQSPEPPHPTHQKWVCPFSKLPTRQTTGGSQAGRISTPQFAPKFSEFLLGVGCFSPRLPSGGYTKFGGGRRAETGKEALFLSPHLGLNP